jgi:hypothetical protein
MLLTIKRCYDWLVAGQGDPRLVAEFRNDVFLLPSIRRSGAARRAHISMERHEEKRKKFIYHSSASSTTRRSPSSHCEIRRHAVDCRSTSARSQIGWDKLPNLNPSPDTSRDLLRRTSNTIFLAVSEYVSLRP